MKRILLTVFVAFSAILSASAQYSVPEVFASNPEQVVPGLKYSKLKKIYTPQNADYLAEPKYGTGRAWLNLLVPGLAQYTMGEAGLGTLFLVCGLLSETVTSVAIYDLLSEGDLGFISNYNNGHYDYNYAIPLVSSAVMITNYVLSISNAKKIARVKSQYDYDLKKLGWQVTFQTVPFVTPVLTGNHVQAAAGITLAMQF
jgi:hypothetical protein